VREGCKIKREREKVRKSAGRRSEKIRIDGERERERERETEKQSVRETD